MNFNRRKYKSRRYRALSILVPFANGAFFAAGYSFIHGYLGVPVFLLTGQLGAAGFFVHIIGGFLLSAVEIGIAAVIVACFDLFVIGRVFRVNVLPFILGRWRSFQPDIGFRVLLFMQFLLTTAGFVGLVRLAKAFSYWPDQSGSMFAVLETGVAGIMLPLLYTPVLVYGEETRRAAE